MAVCRLMQWAGEIQKKKRRNLKRLRYFVKLITLLDISTPINGALQNQTYPKVP